VRYRVLTHVSQSSKAVEKLREEAGYFVLLASVSAEKSPLEILKFYKEQDGTERN
jgi:hypothetical protein